MQNSTPTVKAETCCSINQQTKVLCKKLVFSVTYLIAVSRPHYLPVYVRVCKLLSGKRTERTAATLHCVLLSQFNIQNQNTATTTPSPSQLGMISAGDQLAIRNAAPSSLF